MDNKVLKVFQIKCKFYMIIIYGTVLYVNAISYMAFILFVKLNFTILWENGKI